jgi:CCR4-NOT transcription complex subunit 1
LEPRPTGPESEEVEALANAYFQKIYATDISIQDVIQLLRQFKTSSEKKEQELFRCMIHNLFDEYRFFHKYPDKELLITARLFGGLVQHQLISSITLGIAHRYVLEAVRKDPDLGDGNNKMFRLVQIALDQFKSRLGEWPQYCSNLIQIPHFSRHNTDLFQEAQRALSNPQSSTGSTTGTQAYEGTQPAGYTGYTLT